MRLRVIEALVEAGWSRHRISTEEKLRPRENPGGRTDIICYDQDFNPKILVECKAENVPISTDVAEQTARYNRTVEAPYLLMTNGLSDYWFHISSGKGPQRLDGVPDLLTLPGELPDRDFNYWKQRSFAGRDSTNTDLRNWLACLLNMFWQGQQEGKIRYIEFNNSPPELELKHYFYISEQNDGQVALGLVSTPYGGTRMVAIINRNRENVGLIDINLDLAAERTSPNATVHSKYDPHNFDIHELVSLKLARPVTDDLANLPHSLNAGFDQLIK